MSILSRVDQILGELIPQVSKAAMGGLRAALNATKTGEKRRRTLDAAAVLAFVLDLVLHRGKSQADLVADHGFKSTVEAVLKARKNIGTQALEWLLKQMAAEEPATFCGYKVYILDGTYFAIPDTPSNVEAFGKHRSSARKRESPYPILKSVMLAGAFTHRICDSVFHKIGQDERTGAVQLIKSLGPNSLVLMDAGYASLALFERFQQAGTTFVCRLPLCWKFKVVGHYGNGDALVEFKSTVTRPPWESEGPKTRKITMLLRMVEYKVLRKGSKVIRLVTTVLNPAVTAKQIADLYHRRWEIELTIKEVKRYLLRPVQGQPPTLFRSKTSNGVLQEALALMVAHNIVRDLITKACHSTEVRNNPLRISFTRALNHILRFLSQAGPISDVQLPGLLAAIANCDLKSHFRRLRSYLRRQKVTRVRFTKWSPQQCRGGPCPPVELAFQPLPGIASEVRA